MNLGGAARPIHSYVSVWWTVRGYRPKASVATIYRSRGTVGPGSLDAGTLMPLDVIDKRLKDVRVFYHGERPKTMLPQSREYYTHIMIQVTDDDLKPHLERFTQQGFYQVVGLRVPDAAFLFEPP